MSQFRFNPMTFPEYAAFVRSRECNYEATEVFLGCDLDPQHETRLHRNARLLHAAIGMQGEVLELFMSNGRGNTKEELGDILFFATLALDALGKQPIPSGADFIRLPEFVEKFSNKVKKLAFYGLKEDETEADALQEVSGYAHAVFRSVLAHAFRDGWTLSDIMSANVAKLSKRYVDKFSAEQAHTRDLEAEKEAVGE